MSVFVPEVQPKVHAVCSALVRILRESNVKGDKNVSQKCDSSGNIGIMPENSRQNRRA